MPKYNKLVRDKIPEYIRSVGGNPASRVASEEEFPGFLFKKLLEEAKELAEAETAEKALEETADVQEVLDAICELLGFSKTEVEKAKVEKAIKRGQFKERIILEES